MKTRLLLCIGVIIFQNFLLNVKSQAGNATRGFIHIDLHSVERIDPLFCQNENCHFNLTICLDELKKYHGYNCSLGLWNINNLFHQPTQKMRRSFEFSDYFPDNIQMTVSCVNNHTNQRFIQTREFPLYQSLEEVQQKFFLTSLAYDSLKLTGILSRQCKKNYYGANCQRFCADNFDEKRYRCNKNGSKVCKGGWSGEDCNIPKCRLGCSEHNGFCDTPGTCRCKYGWKGELCNECEKYPDCKNGFCLDSPFTCICEPNWIGKFCDIPMKYCSYHNKCQNNGICLDILERDQETRQRVMNSTLDQVSRKSLFQCICPDGYKGEFCETKMDICEKDPCLHGVCVTTNQANGKKSYTCSCNPGWEGVHCERIKNLCTDTTCLNNGVCNSIDGVRTTCTCPAGYIGESCEIKNNCSLPCKHAKNCTSSSNTKECNCIEGWSGKYCDFHLDPCHVKPCQNKGKCIDLGHDYLCDCKIGFSGRNCEQARGCLGIRCLNGGICKTNADKIPFCQCTNSFSGLYCETPRSKCKPNPCLNNSTCYDIGDKIFCKCHSAYVGEFCENLVINSETSPVLQIGSALNCSESNCSPNGICSFNEKKNQDECFCKIGWTGKECQDRVNLCQVSPCLNNGICQQTDENKINCVCQPGFTGIHCEQETGEISQFVKCKNNGTFDVKQEFCLCNSQYSGRWCEFEKETGQDLCNAYGDEICLNGGSCVKNANEALSLTCICEAGYRGKYCHLKDSKTKGVCSEYNICKNNGKCINIDEEFFCQCQNGFEGRYCEDKLDSCSQNPCQNQGKCISSNGTFHCKCPSGFYGHDCSKNINECEHNQCSFGSKCIDLINEYQCLCPKGRTGRLCDEVIRPDFINHPSCMRNNQTFDHQEVWNESCQECTCNLGKIECKIRTCLIPTCLNAEQEGYPEFTCKADEICEMEEYPLGNRCLIEPCFKRYTCIKENSFQISRFLHMNNVGQLRECLPNSYTISKYCVAMKLALRRENLPYGLYSNDICNAIGQFLPLINLQLLSNHSKVVINCDFIGENESELLFLVNYALEEDVVGDSLSEDRINLALNETKLHLRQVYNEDFDKMSEKKFQSKHLEQKKFLLRSLTRMKHEKTDRLLFSVIIKAVTRIEYEPFKRANTNEMEDINNVLIPLIFISTLIIALLMVILIWAYAKKKRNELIANYLKIINHQTTGEDYKI